MGAWRRNSLWVPRQVQLEQEGIQTALAQLGAHACPAHGPAALHTPAAVHLRALPRLAEHVPRTCKAATMCQAHQLPRPSRLERAGSPGCLGAPPDLPCTSPAPVATLCLHSRGTDITSACKSPCSADLLGRAAAAQAAGRHQWPPGLMRLKLRRRLKAGPRSLVGLWRPANVDKS